MQRITRELITPLTEGFLIPIETYEINADTPYVGGYRGHAYPFLSWPDTDSVVVYDLGKGNSGHTLDFGYLSAGYVLATHEDVILASKVAHHNLSASEEMNAKLDKVKRESSPEAQITDILLDFKEDKLDIMEAHEAILKIKFTLQNI